MIPGSAAGAGQEAEFAPGQIIVRLRQDLGESQSGRIVQAAGARAVDELAKPNLLLVEVHPGQERAKIEELLQDPRVEAAELNYVVRALVDPVIPDDTYYGSQWALGDSAAGNIDAPHAWALETGSTGQVIAIIDTGVALAHVDLDAKIVPGYDFVNDDSDPSDDHYASHGTHVAGIAAAETDNSQGVAGISWGASIMPIKVLASNGYGTFYDVIEGIYYAVENGADVINMSLGARQGGISPEELTSLQEAINHAHASGCVVVAAAGNSYEVHYPAACDNVMAVAATYSNDNQYGSDGPEMDVAAPGVSIWSTKRYNSYGYMTGSSMASPHVAGLASLVLSLRPDYSPDQVKSLIENGAEDKGVPGWDQSYGWGRIDAFQTLVPLVPASMSGTVTDNRDIPIHDVALNMVAGGSSTTNTDFLGQYTFSDLISGTYALQAEEETYGDLPPMKSIQVVSATETAGLDLVMPPTDNLMGDNWDFEAGELSTGWVISSTEPAPQRVAEPHTGDYSARLGGSSASGGLSAFYSQVYISGTESIYEPTLSFRYRYEAGDGDDHFRAWIGDGGGAWLADALPAQQASAEDWTHAWFDMSDYAGSTIRIYLEVWQQDASGPSQAYVDEVSLGKASGGAGRFYLPLALGSDDP
jgi:subtilisin family serine protease